MEQFDLVKKVISEFDFSGEVIFEEESYDGHPFLIVSFEKAYLNNFAVARDINDGVVKAIIAGEFEDGLVVFSEEWLRGWVSSAFESDQLPS